MPARKSIAPKPEQSVWSVNRCIHTSDAETYRPIAELDAIEAEARETDKALRKILKQLGL